jgi:hypothetical protein
MKSDAFVERAKIIAAAKTVYLWGTFGAPLTNSLIFNKSKQYPSWYSLQRQARFKSLVGKNYFAFDCVGLIKAILWGWVGNAESYGGAKYTANQVPDIDANVMIKMCTHVSMEFDNIIPGEVVWMKGHIGIYIGEGKVVECTPSFKDGVQITALENIGEIKGLNSRKWTSHGQLPWVNYQLKDANEQLISDMKAAGRLNDEKYWIEVLRGIRIPDPQHIATVFRNSLKPIEK